MGENQIGLMMTGIINISKLLTASSAFVYTKRHFACWEVSQSHNITVPVVARF